MLPDRLATTRLRGMMTVASVFFAFLLFAQFGLLKLLQQAADRPGQVRLAMAIMGLAGLATSLWAGALLARRPARHLIVSGLTLCAASATIASYGADLNWLLLVSAATGVGIALATVAVASDLVALVPSPRRGIAVGLAIGGAYFACNLPVVFDADPSLQARLVAVVCLLGVLATPRKSTGSPESSARTEDEPQASTRAARFALSAVVAAFLALVWLDSAAFAVIQQTVTLKGLTWGEPTRLLAIGTTHLLAAVAAGALLDRGHLQSLLVGSFGLFAVSFLALTRGSGPLGLVGPGYAIGISLYSVSLVCAPSLLRSPLPVRRRAALLYGIAGWLGSALGVGMAQELHDIPDGFLLASGAVLVAAWALSRPGLALALLREAAPAGVWLVVALATTALFVSPLAGGTSSPLASDTDPIARGRAVYVREGCINCHSQYVRPGTRDEILWGPARPMEAETTAPLIGMRRQGPDLLNAGNRRSSIWHRAHLIDPTALSPGSRMPSYAHLFSSGDGEALVAYLSSLGTETTRQRFDATQKAPVPASLEKGSASAGAALFARHCAVCHGRDARGDGEIDIPLDRPTMNLRKGDFWLAPYGPDFGTQADGLARVIKFGVPGTSMPGHEYFTDRQIADLVAYVSRLGASEGTGSDRLASASPPATAPQELE